MGYGNTSKKKTTSINEKLKEHSKHHSKKHMNEMINDMKKGHTFIQSHKKAMIKVGK